MRAQSKAGIDGLTMLPSKVPVFATVVGWDAIPSGDPRVPPKFIPLVRDTVLGSDNAGRRVLASDREYVVGRDGGLRRVSR